MDQQHSSTSKVTVEYHDPHDVYKLLAPGLVPRLPLHNLHWQSHSGPLRSIDTLHVELIRAGDTTTSSTSTPALRRSDSTSTVRDDGFQTQNVGGGVRPTSSETVASSSQASVAPVGGAQRRHQIPGLRRTPYLKVLLVRCDDNDSYKGTVRAEVREWVKTHAATPGSSKKSGSGSGGGVGSSGSGAQEAHDAFEWLIIHVVIPNTAAATQPRSSSAKFESASDVKGASSRWRTGSTPLMEKFQSDFNASGKGAVDRVAQIRIGINDVPYDLLPRVVPAVPTGYTETDQDAQAAWDELVAKFKDLILISFDRRVAQYEEDIKEKDAQRTLPGWNFCTFFILKEGLARGFENVGLVEDALVGYDELSIGLDVVVQDLASPQRIGGALNSYTEELQKAAENVLDEVLGGANADEEEAVDLQSKEPSREQFDDIPISATKKAYRDLILANNVSVFEFRCYIFARQIALLLRLGNAVSTREELLGMLRREQESVLHGVAPRAPPPQKQKEEGENLGRLAEICRRTLQFIPTVSQIMRQDIMTGLAARTGQDGPATLSQGQMEVIDNMVASFAFSVAQQILAQTSTKALPIPPSTLAPLNAEEPKASIPEPKTMMHPARGSSLSVRTPLRPPSSPGVFPGPGHAAALQTQESQFAKAGLEELGARRADLYLLSRSILEGLGKKRGWSNGWDTAPLVGDPDDFGMVEISLDDEDCDDDQKHTTSEARQATGAGIGSRLLLTALDNDEDFYRLYEILTDKAMRHFMVAEHDHSVHANMSDLAVLKYYQKEYRAASSFFCLTAPHFGKDGWSWLELSMLVMYSHCLRELQSTQEYINVALTLLTKASAVEREWQQQRSKSRVKGAGGLDPPDMSCIAEAVGSLSDLVASIPTEAKVPLGSFFTDVELEGPPRYHEGKDSCEVTLRLRCLLPEGIDIDTASLRIASTDGGPVADVWFKTTESVSLARGPGTITFECSSVVPGTYSIDQLRLSSGNLVLHFAQDANKPPAPDTEILKQPQVKLYQRVGALDVEVSATKHTALDKNNGLDLVLSTGWNTLSGCEVRVKPASGGLRLLTTEATLPKEESSGGSFAKPPETGVFFFGPMEAGQSSTVRFPYTVEQDLAFVSLKLEVTYNTTSGQTYYLAKFISVPIALAVGVNVQDVFKHDSLFSRFSVSTASASPLRLFESELLESELFESYFGHPPSGAVMVFPKQPATLLYMVKRKPGVKSTKRSSKMMYLKLHYSQLHAEIEELVSLSIAKLLEQTPTLASYARTVRAIVVDYVRSGLDALDLERSALLGVVSTKFLGQIQWETNLKGLGVLSDTGEDAGAAIATLLNNWQKEHPRLPIPETGLIGKSSILIPVEIQSVPVVHTADIRLDPLPQAPFPGAPSRALNDDNTITPTVAANQVLSATLHLKWTRIWDTLPPRKDEFLEFSYEVTASPETWLLGGRRKGHFVIPSSTDDESLLSSTAETEASIPLTLIPQKEGWLPYPSVEIREVSAEGDEQQQQQQQQTKPAAPALEVDWRNLGETVRVVGGRTGVTVSLDASGPGGGPLVLGVDRVPMEGGRVVT